MSELFKRDLNFEKDAVIFDGSESIEFQQQPNNNITHGIIVGNQVLTAPEANVYTKVMKIVDDNKMLKQYLQQNAHRLKQHVEELKTYKDERKKAEESLKMEIHKEKENSTSIQKKLDCAFEIGTNSVKKKIKQHLDALQELLISLGITEGEESENVDSQDERNIITDAVQAVTETFQDGYVIVNRSDKLDVILKESKDKLQSFHSLNAEKARSSIQAIQTAIQESTSGQFSDSSDGYFQKFVEQKSIYDSLVTEHQHLTEVQKDYNNLKVKMSVISAENARLQNELSIKSEKILRLEDLSLEFKLQTSDEYKMKIEKLESELETCQIELESTQKHNQQLQNDLKENSETFEMTDQKCVELESEVQKLRLQLQEIPKQQQQQEDGDEVDKMTAQMTAQIRELTNCKAILEQKIADQDKAYEKSIQMYKKRENNDNNKRDRLMRDKKDLEEKLKKLEICGSISNVECEPEILISTDSETVSVESVNTSEPTAVASQRFPSTETDTSTTEEVQALKENISNLQNEIQELNEKVQVLEHEKNTLQQQSDQHNVELNTIQSHRFDNDRNFEEVIAQKEAVIRQLTKESEDLRDFIQHCQRENIKLRNSYDAISQDNEMRKQNFDKVQRDGQDLFKQLQDKARLYNEKTAEYYAAESCIEKLRDDNTKMIGVLKLRDMEVQAFSAELKNEKETLEILRVQVRVYENDFNAERAAREKQSVEQQKLKTDVESLRAERDQLRLELNRRASQSGFTAMRERLRSGVNPPPQSLPQEQQQYQHPGMPHSAYNPQQQPRHQNYGNNPNIYGRGNENQNRKPESQDALHRPCPKCNELFPDLDTLQIHLIECIDD